MGIPWNYYIIRGEGGGNAVARSIGYDAGLVSRGAVDVSLLPAAEIEIPASRPAHQSTDRDDGMLTMTELVAEQRGRHDLG